MTKENQNSPGKNQLLSLLDAVTRVYSSICRIILRSHDPLCYLLLLQSSDISNWAFVAISSREDVVHQGEECYGAVDQDAPIHL